MKKIFSILILFAACLTSRAQLNTVAVGVTNAPVNTSTLTIGSTVFNWTNGTPIPPYSVAIGASLGADGTNLYKVVISVLPALGISTVQIGATNLIFQGIGLTGSIFSTVPGAAWGVITNTAGGAGSQTNVVVPISSVDSSIRPSIESQLASDIDQYSTYAFVSNSPSLNGYVSTNTIQNVWGKTFYSTTNISGSFLNPIFTNGQNFGLPFRSPGTGTGSEQFGLSASATQSGAVAFGDGATASGTDSSAYGFGSQATGIGSTSIGENAQANGIASTALGINSVATNNSTTAIGFNAQALVASSQAFGLSALASNANALAIGPNSTSTNSASTALGYLATTTTDHQVMLGTSSEYVQFPGGVLFTGQETNISSVGTNRLGGVLIYPRFLNTSIANGGNAAVNVSTNRYTKLSGPTGSFSIAGVARGLPDREVVLINSTSQVMTISNDSGTDPTATNRIYTVVNATGGADIVGSNAITLLYDFSLTHWVVVGAR